MEEANETIISMLKDLQRQMTYLERKIDTLVAQSAGRSSGGRPSPGKSFSSPSRSYGEQKRYDAPRGERSSGGFESKHGGSSHGYDKKRGDEGKRYVEKKKFFRPGDSNRGPKKFKSKFE